MKKAPVPKPKLAPKPGPAKSSLMRDEYRFDYSQAKPNRFAAKVDRKQLLVALDADVSAVFSTPEAVNKALRALILAMPTRTTPPAKKVNNSCRKRGA